MLEISLAGAFLGGVLALLSPCSALLLPAFFAYAFKTRRELVARTLAFFLGLCTLFIPLGMGAGFAAAIVLDYRETAIRVAGGILILFGVLELAGVGFRLLPARWAGRPRSDGGWAAVYSTGLVYGFAGFCSGPLLGAVLTMAAGSGSALRGAVLLFAYALGMAAPLFILAACWDRYQLGQRRWLRGRVLRLGPVAIHTSNLIAGALFIGLGVTFIATGATVRFDAFYQSLGLIDFSYRAEQWVRRITNLVPDWAWIGALVPATAAALAWRRRRNSQRSSPPL